MQRQRSEIALLREEVAALRSADGAVGETVERSCWSDSDESAVRVEFEDLEAEREAWRAALAVDEKQGNKVTVEVARMELKRLRNAAAKQNKKQKQKKKAGAEKLLSETESSKAAEK